MKLTQSKLADGEHVASIVSQFGSGLSSSVGVKQNLCAAEQRHDLAAGLVFALGVPNLGGPSAMHEPRFARHPALARRAQTIRLKLGGGKSYGPLRKRREAPVATGRVGPRHNCCRVKEPGGRQ